MTVYPAGSQRKAMSGTSQRGYAGNRAGPTLRFKLIDADGDKKISLKEFISRSVEARFKQMDRDNDGKLTWDEFKGTRKPEELEQAELNFKRMDTDGDKCPSLDEFRAGQKQPGKPAKKAAGKKFQPKPVQSAVKE
jgi:hypothetical protein